MKGLGTLALADLLADLAVANLAGGYCDLDGGCCDLAGGVSSFLDLAGALQTFTRKHAS